MNFKSVIKSVCERLWGPPSLLSNGYQGPFPWGHSGLGVKLNTHLHLVPRSKNEWSYTSTPYTPSWSGAPLKHRDNFTFTYFRIQLWVKFVFSKTCCLYECV